MGIWLSLGAPALSGPVSLRKPILFGFSAGVTLVSLAWVLRHLPPRRGDGVLYGSVAVALVLEVSLIDLQQARGVPSHFNRATPFDELVLDAMAALVLWATVGIIDATVRSLRAIELPEDLRLAARAGLVLLVVGSVVGIVITLVGEARAEAGLPPERLGGAGVPKFPHGLPLHAIQILPLQGWVLRRLGVPGPARARSVALGAAALGVATAYGVAQAVSGAPRFPPVGVGWPLFATAVTLGVAAAGVAWRGGPDQARPGSSA